MNPATDIVSPRLILKPLRERDAEVLFEGWTQSPAVCRFLQWRTHRKLAETTSFMMECIAQAERKEKFYFVAWVKEGDEAVGFASLKPEKGMKVMIGFLVFEKFQGRGIGTEVARALLDHAFEDPGILRVWALCDTENVAPQRVLEKTGMTKEGILRRWGIHPNVSDEPRDVVCYATVKRQSVS